jgi:hypothetical protein
MRSSIRFNCSPSRFAGQRGAPLGIDGEMASTRFTFQAGMPVDRSDVSPGDNVRG